MVQPPATTKLDRAIVQQARQEPLPTQQAIINLVTTIIAYKFTHLSRQEVEDMLGFTTAELEKSHFYQEVKAEGERLLLLRLLSQRLGDLTPGRVTEITSLPLGKLEALGSGHF